MRLERLSERVWVFPYEERRDRPNLCYIKGDNWSIAVDAGHSADHVMEFYKAIEEEGFPPLKIVGRHLDGGHISVPGHISSQFISALLMVEQTLLRGTGQPSTAPTAGVPLLEVKRIMSLLR